MDVLSSTASAEHVRAALEHLYENVLLARSPLADLLPDVAAQQDLEARAQLLRRNVLNAIERLRPARPTAFTDHAARSYQVLSLRYLEEMSITQVADELGVGERQAYRELRRAEADLASVLASFFSSQQRPTSPEAEPLEQELKRLVSQPRRLDLDQVIAGVVQGVEPMAAHHGITMNVGSLCPARLLADEGLLRQLLTQLLSLALQSASGGTVLVETDAIPGLVELRLQFLTKGPMPPDLLLSAQRLAEVQHVRLGVDAPDGAPVTMRVVLKVVEPRVVLVVEDNEGATELYRRYVADRPEWQIVAASDPRVCVDMASRLRPSVVVLDIMMPQRDGWTVLQSLRARPDTGAIPVVICSVFYDLGLAQALGATEYLKKPVSRLEFLAALERCLAA
ncbi:MAG: response regulator [Anaerolineae bacterium]